MSELIGSLDPAAGAFGLPLWTAGVTAALFAALSLLAFNHAGRDGLIGAFARVALVLIGASMSWIVLAGASRPDIAAERRALDARVQELQTRAAAPGSALACLDAMAGETVEASCEKALFQTPETMAAAVSYVSAQLNLLGDLTQHAARSGASLPPALADLRRAAETDRFGLVARVLAHRDGCTPEACRAFALLSDSSRVAANLSERTYDLYVIRYSAVWPANAKTPLAAQAPGPSPDATAGRGAGIFLPSAASIPPVNIMNTEPALPAEAPARAATSPSPARRPAQSSAPSQPGAGGSATLPTRQPVDLNALRSPAPAYAPQ